METPVAALLTDLKSRGLLDETLVVWASEMGRTPFINDLSSDKPGRDHNQWGLTVWMAGGDVKGGTTAGETDEFGIKALGEPIPLRDVHATILDLLGLSDERLTYLHAGRLPQAHRHRGTRASPDRRVVEHRTVYTTGICGETQLLCYCS